MALELTVAERTARARADIRQGAVVAVRAGSGDALVAASETLSPERLADLRALGQPELAITGRRASTLKLAAYDGDIARLVLPSHADCAWIRAVADPARDLQTPMKGPFSPLRGGGADAHRAAVRLAKLAHLLPAAVVLPHPEAVAIAAKHGLAVVEAEALEPGPLTLRDVASARVPLAVSEAGRVHVFRPEDGGEEHFAVEVGTRAPGAPVLTRLHSACFTGDVIGSLKCDCGPQLHTALERIGAEGGILLYLNQEGRGIGLANKMRAYALQDQGFDTVDANHRLGFEDDERDFRIGAEILKSLGVSAVRLMTNNPAKVELMRAQGIEVVDRVPLIAGRTEQNEDYLATKAAKSGHLF